MSAWGVALFMWGTVHDLLLAIMIVAALVAAWRRSRTPGRVAMIACTAALSMDLIQNCVTGHGVRAAVAFCLLLILAWARPRPTPKPAGAPNA